MKTTPFPCVLAALLLSLSSAFSAEPRITNRAPAPDEVGYRPADGASVPLNPPSFLWLHEPAAVTYTIQWSLDEQFNSPQNQITAPQIAAGIPWNTYTHHTPFNPGMYYWRYRFTDAAGATSNWSQVRKVIVPPDAQPFPMPTRAQQKERVPQQHPRLFIRPEDLPNLRQLAKGREAKLFASLQSAADKFIAAGPTPEPEHMGSAREKDNAELVKYWWPNREQTMKACNEAETIAFVYLLTQDEKYKAAARKWILHLASWNPDGPTNMTMNCEAAKPLLYRLPRAYDWAYDALSDADRKVVQAVMLRRISDAWKSGEIARGTGHLNKPYNSHGNRIWHKVGEAGIAFLNEIPEAETWLDYAVNKFHACYPVWSDDDGGWHEGVSYWAGYMSKVVWWLQVSDKALQIDGLKKPFFAQVGDFPMYVAPPNSPNMGFGDLSYNRISRSTGQFMDYFIRAKGAQPDGASAQYWRWWCQQWQMPGQDSGVLGFLYHASLPALPPAKAPDDLPSSKIFHGIGVAALNSSLLDARDAVQFLFKSSPFGTQSHGHNPHNSFQLNAYGDPLLVANTYRDLHGSKFHYQYVHSTAAQNCVLVNGQGQKPHTPSPDGRIAASQLTKEYDYVMGDATPAYAGRLTRFHRHVLFLKPDVIVLYDDLAAPEPSTFQFMLHALKEFQVDEKSSRLSLTMPNAALTVQYLSPTPLSFRQTSGFNPPPTKEFPTHYHLEAFTQQKQTSLGMLTLLLPHRPNQPSDFTAQREETATTLTLRLTRSGQTATITFRKHNPQQPSTDAPVVVESFR